MNRLLLINVAFASALFIQAGSSPAVDSGNHNSHSPGLSAMQQFSVQMDAGMSTMMKQMHGAGQSGSPDIDFLAMMIPHHEGAVEMARLLLIYGKDPLTRRLAEEIIASQTAEITAMKNRLAILRRGEDPNPGGFPALHGTRGVAAQ